MPPETFGEKFWRLLAADMAERASAKRPAPTREERIALLNKLHEDDIMHAVAERVKAGPHAAGLFDMPAPAPKPKRPKPLNAMSRDEFIATLEERFVGIDVKREIGKCQWHFKTYDGIEPGRNRIVNWLKRAERDTERPLAFNGAGASSYQPAKQTALDEPPGWREWVRENATDPAWADKPWSALDRSAQNYIREQLKASA